VPRSLFFCHDDVRRVSAAACECWPTVMDAELPSGVVPQLPVELFERIVDFLHNDTESLRCCALASGALLLAARTHLFRVVHVSNARAWDNLDSAIQATPSLADLIHTFSVSDHKQFLTHVIGHSTLQDAVRFASQLRLRDLYYLGAFADRLDALLPDATSLELERVQFKFSRTLFTCIHAHPRLRSLTLIGVTIRLTLFGDEELEGSRLDIPGIVDLRIDGQALQIFLGQHLGFTEISLNLAPKRLFVEKVMEDNLFQLATVLRMIGSKLEDFHVALHEFILGPMWQGWCFCSPHGS
jgi:hypothetical protein